MSDVKEDEKLVAQAAGDSTKLSDLYKDKGNGFFKTQKYVEAIEAYTWSVKHNNKNDKALLNRAFCFLKQENWTPAEEDCTKVLGFMAKNAKALYRRGQARMGLKKLAEALQDLKLAAVLEPTDKVIKDELSRCEAMLNPLAGIPLTARWRRISPYQYSSDITKPAEVCSHNRHITFADDFDKPLLLEETFHKEEPPTEVHPLTSNKNKTAKPILMSIEARKRSKNNSKTISSATSENTPPSTHDTKSNNQQLDDAMIPGTPNSDDDDLSRRNSATKEEPVVEQGDSKDFISGFKTLLNKNESVSVPEKPSTLLELKSTWSSLSLEKDKPLQMYKKYKYIMQIDPKDYAKVIGSGLESDFLSDLSVISSHALLPKIEASDSSTSTFAISMLKSLSKVERFSLAYMFLQSSQKSGFEATVKAISGAANVDKADAEALKKIYL